MLADIKTILYATDLGENVRPVFRMAVSLAKKYDAKIIILHAVEPLGSYGKTLLESYLPKGSSEELHKEGFNRVSVIINKRLKEFCDEELSKEDASTDFVKEIVVIEERPANAVKNEAERRGADLIVMGTHSQSPVEEIFMGSVARRVTQITNVPVLLVPIPKHST